MRFSPQWRAIFQHLNFKKCSEADVFCTFWLPNVLLATATCNFWTSQLQKVLPTPQFFCIFTSKCASRHSGVIATSKVVRTCSVLYILTSKCASRYSGVQFLHISTSKSAPNLQFFSIFTSKYASRHSGVQFLISPLTTWLRTGRFSEPTFRLTRHTNHWKNTAFRDFSNIWRGWIFFLLTFVLLHLLSSDSTSSSDFTFFWLHFIYLLFICFSTFHIVGSLLFKLPSTSFMDPIGWDMIDHGPRTSLPPKRNTQIHKQTSWKKTVSMKEDTQKGFLFWSWSLFSWIWGLNKHDTLNSVFKRLVPQDKSFFAILFKPLFRNNDAMRSLSFSWWC